MKNILLLLIVVFSLASCTKDNEITIEEYLEQHGLVAQKHSSGIYYIIEKEGTGGHPNVNSLVTMNYKGYFLNDEQFDSSYDRGEPLKYYLNGLILGWQIGVPLFKKGGKGKLFIPPEYGYGSNPPTGIPKDATLIFDIELIDFK